MSLRFGVLFFVCSLLVSRLSAQPLTSYVNIQNQVIVWDNGMIRKIDYLPPTDMKVGRTAIPYLDNSRSFKIYYAGGVKNVNSGFTNEFRVSDHLVSFSNAKSLNVFDRGAIKNLSGLCPEYYLGDSVLLFFDAIRSEYKAYYNGAVYPIENFLAADTILQVVKVSDNVAAYDNYANQFRIFYHGAIISQEEYSVSTFGVGRNTVAYVDVNQQFKIFNNGQTYIAEGFPPQSYSVGDNVVAYISSDGYFKIFYMDSLRTMGYFSPDYQVGDNVVAYKDGSGYFKVFYKGDVTSVESYYPENMVIQYNSLAYVNRAGVLRMFSEGEVYDVTNASVDSWLLSYDVLKYQIGRNYFKVFYKGTEY